MKQQSPVGIRPIWQRATGSAGHVHGLLITIEQSNGIVVSLASEQYLCLSHRTHPVTLSKDSQARTDTRQHMWNEPTHRQKGTERSVVVCFWTKLSARCGLAISFAVIFPPILPSPSLSVALHLSDRSSVHTGRLPLAKRDAGTSRSFQNAHRAWTEQVLR